MSDLWKKVRPLVTFETVLVFVLGLSIGLYVKSVAAEHVTSGFDDPKIQTDGHVYDIDQMEQRLIQRGIPLEQEAAEESAPLGE